MPKLYKNVVLWDAERESASLCDVLTEGAEIAKIAPAGTLCGTFMREWISCDKRDLYFLRIMIC